MESVYLHTLNPSNALEKHVYVYIDVYMCMEYTFIVIYS